jgi:hypothetical protein
MDTTRKESKAGYKGLEWIPLAEDNVQRWTPFLRGLLTTFFEYRDYTLVNTVP